eukprot:4094477-Pyramimonas_sp.AAC.1
MWVRVLGAARSTADRVGRADKGIVAFLKARRLHGPSASSAAAMDRPIDTLIGDMRVHNWGAAHEKEATWAQNKRARRL